MPNRLTKITTRTGDDGTTGLADGSRVVKYHLRVEVIGEIDELNSALGVVLAEQLPDNVREMLTAIQHDLFDLGGEIATPGQETLEENHIVRLDTFLSEFSSALPPLKEFILPGGCRAAALTHVARSACRRAERRLIALSKTETVSKVSQKYLNRLSDLLFQLSRVINIEAGAPNVYWRPHRSSENTN